MCSCQVLFHTDIEREAGHFDIDDVADAACRKLVYRHPHVFRRNDLDAPDWDTIKQRERAQTTTAEAMDCVARSLPALWRCEKIQAKAAKTGFEWPDMAAALDKVAEETQELREAAVSGDAEAVAEELGDLLFAVVKVARFAGVDPEQAAHAGVRKIHPPLFRHGGRSGGQRCAAQAAHARADAAALAAGQADCQRGQ